MKPISPLSIALCSVLVSVALHAQSSKEFDITGANAWTDTGLDLKPGDTLRITASGTVQYPGAKPSGPEGLGRSWTDLIRQLPLNEAGRGSLIGRIGDSAAARAFLVGPRTEHRAPIGGRLYLGINQAANDQPDGSYHVKVDLTSSPAQPATTSNVPLPKFTQKLLDSIPARVEDAEGNPGDRVNFVVIGSQARLEAAFRAAGWVTVDRTRKDAVLRGLLSSLSKEAYVTMPMSELMLFGRVQDYGYAQGDPIRVVASRHHLRMWKAPFTVDGQTVWAGAGTHDIGFDKDQRNGKLTHKIDPDTDGEREYIGQSLQQSGLVAKLDYMRPKTTVETARTAHGEEFHSDGRTLLVYLQPDDPGMANNFGDIFCSVLKQNNPDKGDWGACEQYIDGGGRTDLKLQPLTATYRVLIVPGFMSSCFADSPAFQEGQKSLKEQYNIAVDLLSVSNDPSEENAKVIANFLTTAASSDPRKFIVLGYSKGAPDVMTALALEDGAASHVAAFVSVAGAIGGSPIADTLPAAADRWIRQFNMKGCSGDTAAGFKSLRRETRQAFLAAYPRMPVPSYSIVTKSDSKNTSKALLETWRLLAAYGLTEDGQLLRDDSIVPESKVLGVALADHFAVALPFDKSADSLIRGQMDKTRYPRAALLESVYRFVSADIAK